MLKRIGDMIAATIHEGLDKLEDPRVMLNHYLRSAEQELYQARDSIRKQQMLEQGFRRKAEEARNMAKKRHQQAQLAFDAGEEGLARAALAEMKHYEAKAQEYQEVSERLAEQLTELRGGLAQLEERVQALKDKKHALIARAHAARTKEQIFSSLHRVDSSNTFREFQRLEERIMELEMKANAWDLEGWSSPTPSLAALEYAEEAERELEKMRQAKNRAQHDAQEV